VGDLDAPSEGWILVGFNRPGAGLNGARLFFFALDAHGRLRAEEHIADPPGHAPRATGGCCDQLRVVEARQRAGRTRTRFLLPRAPARGSDLVLTRGAPTELILAYGDSDDFDHHSRHRVHRRLEL